jgi:hypothetical protein
MNLLPKNVSARREKSSDSMSSYVYVERMAVYMVEINTDCILSSDFSRLPGLPGN